MRFQEDTRLEVNWRLRQLCEEMRVEYLEYETEENEVIWDGLHLNDKGKEGLARRIYGHYRHFLW